MTNDGFRNSTNNRIVTSSQAPGGVVYDPDGRLTSDRMNTYLWEAQGRLCGVTNTGTGNAYQYVYDAEGNLVTMASRSSANCSLQIGLMNDFVVDQGGRKITTVDASHAWKSTNVYANGELLATYDTYGLHFAFNDWQGTKRVQASPSGTAEMTCWNLPFNDAFGCSSGADDPSGLHYTGKEHDPYTGLDLFGAREYTNYSGRFLSPDWSAKVVPVPYAKLDNPQSLNLYAYVGNNPLSRTDPDGHCGTPTGLKPGQVGVCVASFIKKSFFWGIGRGDGRDADANGGTSRIETRLIVDPVTGAVKKTNETINRSGILIKDVGPQGVGGSTVSQPSTDQQGDTHFQVSQDAHSSYAAGGVILGSIDNHVNLNVTPDGRVGIDQGSSARDFPSLEVFRYSVDAEGNVSSQQILYKQESGNVGDLKQPETPIAPEAPQ